MNTLLYFLAHIAHRAPQQSVMLLLFRAVKGHELCSHIAPIQSVLLVCCHISFVGGDDACGRTLTSLYRFLHLHVPPPQDGSKHIFLPRSLSIRLQTTLHLTCWFERCKSSYASCTQTCYDRNAWWMFSLNFFFPWVMLP
jgi:hypothetical protein